MFYCQVGLLQTTSQANKVRSNLPYGGINDGGYFVFLPATWHSARKSAVGLVKLIDFTQVAQVATQKELWGPWLKHHTRPGND